MRNLFFICSFVLWGTHCMSAQNEPRFYVEISAVEVVVGEPVQVSFILENGKNNGRFNPPDWETAGFMLLGSSQSSNISIMNGETNTSASYNFTVTPVAQGKLSIPSVRIKNGDSELYTEPIAVQAFPSADGVSPALPKRSPAKPQSEPKRKFKTINM
ncbi:MAG: BatD family protein [Saprospiraceae bacterium]